MGLRIYSSLTRDKQDFVPVEPGAIKMYVCGITSSGPSHVGHARAFVAFDVVYRWLRRSYKTTFVRNCTDIDDKIINAARAAGEDIGAFSERQIAQFESDMAALGCAKPTVEPRVTKHIDQIIDLIAALVKKGFAYSSGGDVYFNVPKFKRYGRLSGRTQEVLNAEAYRAWAGGRLEIPAGKTSPYDFALWKAEKPGEPSWDSPWGRGRPGWHIECSAMSTKYLGETFDIHGGGKDLIFPHHENEIAQSCAASGQEHLARFWMHNGFVNLMPELCPKCGASLDKSDGNQAESACSACGHHLTEDDLKMSKSRGNFYPVREIVSHHQGEALRHLLLMSHYRSPVQFSHRLLEDAEARLDRVYETLRKIETYTRDHPPAAGPGFLEVFGFDPWQRFTEALDDDFNTAKAIGDLSELFRLANELITVREREGGKSGHIVTVGGTSRLVSEIRQIVRDAGEVLGLWLEDPNTYVERRKLASASKLAIAPEQVQALIEERNLARKARDFARSDAIRDELKSKGIGLKDTPKGTDWYPLDS
jgi:cysteinyl-tRNA synthetase